MQTKSPERMHIFLARKYKIIKISQDGKNAPLDEFVFTKFREETVYDPCVRLKRIAQYKHGVHTASSGKKMRIFVAHHKVDKKKKMIAQIG